MIEPKHLDHAYHRSRVDAHINGQIILVGVVAFFAFTAGGKFQPLQHGARLWEPTRMVWVERQQSWMPEQKLIELNDFPPTGNVGPIVVQEIYPISVTVAVVIGVLVCSYFVYRCARRQTRLMNSVFGNARDDVYQRGWKDIRVTFWALNVALLFALFFLIAY